MNIKCETWKIETKNEVRSLVWDGDSLIDWASGAVQIEPSGSVGSAKIIYAYRFDAACSSPSGEYVVLYERLGTKGIVLHHGKILREINRSFCHADVYKYPVIISRLASGRNVLIHCPDDSNRLEIEDVATGERLTNAEGRKPCDFFHSRLATDGVILLSAGWLWHPLDAIGIFRLDNALANPRTLDNFDSFPDSATEISSTTFLDDGRIALATSEETFLDEADFVNPDILRPSSLAVFDLNHGRILSQVPVQESVGTMMKLGHDYVVGFFEHPKVFDLATGRVVWRLSELMTGNQASSIIHHLPKLPSMALDPDEGRFAVAVDGGVQVVKLKVVHS